MHNLLKVHLSAHTISEILSSETSRDKIFLAVQGTRSVKNMYISKMKVYTNVYHSKMISFVLIQFFKPGNYFQERNTHLLTK